MEKLIMSSSVMVAIILCLIGIIKTPFKNFKKNHAKIYKAIFTTIGFLLSVAFAILNEKFVLKGAIISSEFVIIVFAILSGVFGGYNGIYEGLGVKELTRKIVDNLKKIKSISTDKKIIKYLNNIEDIDNAIKILEERKNNTHIDEV